ncbi:MAG: DUF1631 family protein [Pseudomonadota bacterium]
MASALPQNTGLQLGRQARERFVGDITGVMPQMAKQVMDRMQNLFEQAASGREMQDRRDALQQYQKGYRAWMEGTVKAWQRALQPPTATTRVRLEASAFELIGEDVVENKILSSRIAMAIAEKVIGLNDLRLRIQSLENTPELAAHDVLRPEVVAQLLVEQWTAAGLSRDMWLLVQDTVQQLLVEKSIEAYSRTNEFLVERGILPEIDFKSLVRRTASSAPAPGAGGSDASRQAGAAAARAGAAARSDPQGGGGGSGGSHESQGGGAGGQGGNYQGGGSSGGGQGGSNQGGGVQRGGPGSASEMMMRRGGGAQGGSPQRAGGPGVPGSQGGSAARQSSYGGPGGQSGPGGPQGDASRMGGTGDETRMMTSGTPLARARQRAQGLLGQLRRMLSDKGADFDSTQTGRASPALAEAISQIEATHMQSVGTGAGTSTGGGSMAGEALADSVSGASSGRVARAAVGGGAVFEGVGVEQAATVVRQRTTELKKKASTTAEKATIEIVALMFQSILAEERIPAAVRVWFARLQMPVLRVALSEPEFFGTLMHPARQLIDRMGSCVMGFDATTINGSALEAEIKRVVQVIEQYPETGRRVFQLVYEEFQKFLSKFLTESGANQRLVSVAQQVEQKETLAIQYTIEMRNMLRDIPVREEIREFLFKVWAEVLAVAAVKNGPQHEDTIAMKKSASDLVWAASAKPNRNDRARVIQELPALLQRLRQGMTLLGVQGVAQEGHIKVIGDTLADAFLSKTQAIPRDQIDAMAKRLANLEDFVGDGEGSAGDLPLDAESIEMMLGIDASAIEVVADGGSRPSDAMLAWANELQLGTWFTLDHNSKISQVQFAWRSDRKQLHLFASTDGKSYLIQARRLAAYLQAGLLVPTEEEALTVRATRDALAKLDANPERLLN